MTTRTTSTTVTFLRPFILDGFERLESAGAYVVDTEEELMDALLLPAWRRVSTVMRLSRAGATEHIAIDPKQLHEALMRDGAQQDPALPCSASDKARHDRGAGLVAHLTRRRKP